MVLYWPSEVSRLKPALLQRLLGLDLPPPHHLEKH